MPVFTLRSRLDASPEAVRAWHERPGALERLTPPWERVDVEREAAGLAGEAAFRVHAGPLRFRWVARHEPIPDGFVDEQARGPFRRWRHEHTFRSDGAGGTWLEDRIAWSSLLPPSLVRRRLDRMFRWRHEKTAREAGVRVAPQAIGITGSHGMIGAALRAHLLGQGHRVVRLPRRVGASDLAGLDAVVHLAGESISKRWTKARKREILASRVEPTRALVDALAGSGVRALVTASAIGFYGDRGEAEVDETSPRGAGFLADVVEAWEREAGRAEGMGVRVVQARFGIVLSPRGGALKQLLLPFRLGAGGRIASGRAWWSWVDLEDVVGALAFALREPALEGPVLVVAPHPVRNADFTRALARALRRPAILPEPAFALRLGLGEMADELLLASCRARPTKLLAAGYRFARPELTGSLRAMLGRP
ncbi:MAG: uncharacterized protein QOE90_154 [Thermoplasmata archaeon]|jgi:uncharacterized protein (TIGR01777 family)|nr:uncharacterized protein [Thermoplasmata archaeon]